MQQQGPENSGNNWCSPAHPDMYCRTPQCPSAAPVGQAHPSAPAVSVETPVGDSLVTEPREQGPDHIAGTSTCSVLDPLQGALLGVILGCNAEKYLGTWSPNDHLHLSLQEPGNSFIFHYTIKPSPLWPPNKSEVQLGLNAARETPGSLIWL